MTTGQRRGRPPGEGIKDGPVLEALAFAVLDNPRTKVAPVVRSILASSPPGRLKGASDLATIRRIQAKWRKMKGWYLDQARLRRRMPLPSSRTAGSSVQGRGLHTARAIEQAMADLGLSTKFSPFRRRKATVEKALREAHERIRTVISGPESEAIRALSEFSNTPTQRAIREFGNSPTQRAIREMFDGPSMRAMRLLHGGY